MKKTFTILIAALAAILMITQSFTVFGQGRGTSTAYTLTPTTNSASASSSYDSGYDFEINDITWNVVGNTSMNPWRIGAGKKTTLSGTNRVIYSKTAISDNIVEIQITHGSKSGITVNSMSVSVHSSFSDAASGSNPVASFSPSYVDNGTVTITKQDATSWAGMYYRIVYNLTKTGTSSAGYVLFSEALFKKTTYEVAYNANGGSGSVPETSTHDAGATVTVAAKPDGLTNSGYTFGGWNTKNDGTGNNYTAGTGTFNISSDVTLFAKWVADGTPGITASDVNLTQSATSGSIAYEISNPEDEGTLTADVITGSWLSIGTITSSAVGLSCSANNGAERSATVRLTYTYGTKSTTTKDVVVTQAPPQFNVTYDKNGGSGSMTGDATDYDYGSTVTVLENTYTAPTGKMFNCWNDKADGTGNRTYKKDDEFTITSNITLYAQWVNEPTFSLVTDISQIVPGAHCIIANGKGNSASIYAMGYQKSNNRDAVSVSTTSDGKIKNPGETIYKFVISGYANNWTFHDDNSSSTGFLYAASSGSNYLRTEATLDNNGKWAIVINDGTDKYASIVAQGTNTRKVMQFNSNLFACYSDADYDAVYLYIKDNDPDIHPYSSTTYNSGSVTINDAITLSENYNITVGAGATVRFTSTPTCTDASWLVVKEGGQLIIPASKTGVQATFQRKATGFGSSTAKDNYILLANPTTGSIKPEDVDGMLDDNYDLYYFDEAQTGAEWRNYKQGVFNLENGKGYLYANSSDITLNLAGAVPTGTSSSVTLNKKGDGTYAGFNLVGNPMSVNITSMNIGGSGCSYYKLHSSTGVFEASDAQIIVGEAFMVEAENDQDVLTLNPGGKGDRGFNNDVIRLEVSNNKYTDVAYLYFGNHLPLTKINHLNDEAPMIYIHNESANQAVAVMNERSEVKTVNVNFEAKTMGSYTISAKAEKGNFSYMHLYDRLTGVDTDMLENDYTFIGAKEDAAGRFILRFEAVDTDTENEIFAYQSGNNIYVNGEGELQIFDITGRFVMSERINGATSINADALSKGVYVLRIVGSEIKTQKIVVR